MALSKSLHNALIEYGEALRPEDEIKVHVDRSIRRLRHAETDGLAGYEDEAASILRELFSTMLPHVPVDKSSAGVTDSGEGGDGVAVNK